MRIYTDVEREVRRKRKNKLENLRYHRESDITKAQFKKCRGDRDTTIYNAFIREYQILWEIHQKDTKGVYKPTNLKVYKILHKQGYGCSPGAIEKHYRRSKKERMKV